MISEIFQKSGKFVTTCHSSNFWAKVPPKKYEEIKFGIFPQFWAPKNHMLLCGFCILSLSRFFRVFSPSRCQISALYLWRAQKSWGPKLQIFKYVALSLVCWMTRIRILEDTNEIRTECSDKVYFFPKSASLFMHTPIGRFFNLHKLYCKRYENFFSGLVCVKFTKIWITVRFWARKWSHCWDIACLVMFP